jgi:hypothetical protein
LFKASGLGREIASEAFRQFNLRLLEIAREHSETTFEFLGEVINAKDLQAVAELWINHARRQQELWSRQAQEITNLGQRIASESTESASQNVGQTLRSLKP